MARAILDEGDQAFRFGQDFQDAFHYLDVRDIVVAAQIIYLAGLAFPQGRINSGTMIRNVDPVAHMEAIPVHGERLVLEGRGNHEWDKFLRELIGSEVVRAACDDAIQAVGMSCCADHAIGAGLGGRIRVVRLQRGFLCKGSGGSQAAVDLIG